MELALSKTTQHHRRWWIALLLIYVPPVLLSLPEFNVGHQDEPFYFNSIQNMLESGDYLIPTYDGEPRIKKPILFYWEIIAAPLVAGYSVFTVRLASLLASLGLLAVAWQLGKHFLKDYRQRVALIWMLASTDIVYRYAHYVVPEMSLTLAMTAACWMYVEHDKRRLAGEKARGWLYAFYALMGVAFMIKGPVGIILPLLAGLTHRLASQRYRSAAALLSPVGIIIMIAIIIPWYAAVAWKVGWDPMLAMMKHETMSRINSDAGTGPLYFLPILLGYYLPWTLLPLAWLERLNTLKPCALRIKKALRHYIVIWFLTSFLFYTIFVSEKHQWYALQWSVPWVMMLCMAALPDRRLNFRGLLIIFGIASIALGLIVAIGTYLFGPIVTTPLLGILVATAAIVIGLALCWVSRKRYDNFTQIIVLAIAAIVVHLAVMRGVMAESLLRPTESFAKVLTEASDPFIIKIQYRYFHKKLTSYLPGEQPKPDYLEDPEQFIALITDTHPDYILVGEHTWRLAPEAIRNRYTLLHRGYREYRKREDNIEPDWDTFWESRNPEAIVNPILLLKRTPPPESMSP